LNRRHPLSADEVVILGTDGDFAIQLVESLMDHFFPLCRFTDWPDDGDMNASLWGRLYMIP
jgi:hypothetical protein